MTPATRARLQELEKAWLNLLVAEVNALISLANELGAKENSITQTVKRRRRMFDRILEADGIQRIRLVK